MRTPKNFSLVILAVLAFGWSGGANAQISTAESMRRDTELNAWINDLTLPAEFRIEAARVQTVRNNVNKRGVRFGRMVQGHKLADEKYSNDCTGHQLTRLARESCNERLEALESERHQLDAENLALQEAAAAVNADYKALRGSIQLLFAAAAPD